MKSIALSYLLNRTVVIVFSLSIICVAHGTEQSSLQFIKVGSRYSIIHADNVALPYKVTILESGGAGWFRCAHAPVQYERVPHSHPDLPETQQMWINFTQISGVVEISNASANQMSELEKAIAKQELKVEEDRKVLATVKERFDAQPKNADISRDEAIRRGIEAEHYVDAKKDFETDQELLKEMKLKLISEKEKKE